MRLFDYSKEFQVLRDLALDIDFNSETGEIIDNSDTLRDLWNELSENLGDKLDSATYVIKELETSEQMLRNEVDRLNKKARFLAKQSERIRDMMRLALFASDNDKLKTEKFTFSIRKSKSLEIDEMITNLEFMPKQFVRVKKEYDKKAITDAIKAGEVVEGCELVDKEAIQIR